MPAFRVDVVDYRVWEWVKSLLQDPANIMDGLRGLQEERRREHKTLYDRLDLIPEQLNGLLSQQEKLAILLSLDLLTHTLQRS